MNQNQLNDATEPRSVVQQACSVVFAAVYALKSATTDAQKVFALRSVFIREPMFISVAEAEELSALEFYIAETILLPNDQARNGER